MSSTLGEDSGLSSGSATSKVAERVLDVLVCLMDAEGELGVSEIARRVGIDKGRVHRFLVALKRKGFVVDNPGTRRYSVGYRAVEFTRSVSRQLELEQQAQRFLRQLRDEVGETSGLAMRVGNQRLMIAQFESQQEIRQTFPLFEPLPLYLGASSKVLLAFHSDKEIEVILQSIRRDSSQFGSSDIDALCTELALVRERGWAISLGERVVNSQSIAAPAWTWWGEVLALVISGPSSRFTKNLAEQAIPILVDTASQFTREIGGTTYAANYTEAKVS